MKDFEDAQQSLEEMTTMPHLHIHGPGRDGEHDDMELAEGLHQGVYEERISPFAITAWDTLSSKELPMLTHQGLKITGGTAIREYLEQEAQTVSA